MNTNALHSNAARTPPSMPSKRWLSVGTPAGVSAQGQFEYQMIAPDDYVCPQCGGGWAVIAGRECENRALRIELWGGA